MDHIPTTFGNAITSGMVTDEDELATLERSTTLVAPNAPNESKNRLLTWIQYGGRCGRAGLGTETNAIGTNARTRLSMDVMLVETIGERCRYLGRPLHLLD
jgi:hypothetical protein